MSALHGTGGPDGTRRTPGVHRSHRSHWTAVLLILLLFTLAACGSARRGPPFTEPMEMTDASRHRGEQVFFHHCHPCHPGGEAGLGPALNNKPLPVFMIRMQVRRGFGAMPSFSKGHISDEQLDDLVEYLKALRGLH